VPQSNIEKYPNKASETGCTENTGLFCLLLVVLISVGLLYYIHISCLVIDFETYGICAT
jgi:hypothetical protein